MEIIKTKKALALILGSGIKLKKNEQRIYINQKDFNNIWGNFFYSNISDFKQDFKETISKMKLYINVEYKTLHCNKASIRDIFNNVNIDCTY
jgi:hypothetical protein